MSRLRWRKILRDLRQNTLRSLLAIFAMVIGIFAVGSILAAYAILIREINVNFLGTNPASAILYVNNTDRDVADAVAHLPGIAAAEPRRVVNARVALGRTPGAPSCYTWSMTSTRCAWRRLLRARRLAAGRG